MNTTFDGTMQPLDTTIPDPALNVLIGAAGSGKSTWAQHLALHASPGARPVQEGGLGRVLCQVHRVEHELTSELVSASALTCFIGAPWRAGQPVKGSSAKRPTATKAVRAR